MAKKIRKVPVVARVSEGFIGNRIYAAYRRECEILLEEGAYPEQVDAALEAFGFPMGPFAVTDLLGGQIDYMFADAANAVPQINAGKLRGLASSGLERLATAPGLPTMDEAGVKGFDVSYWTGVYLPPGTPAAIVARVHQLIEKASTAPEVKALQITTGNRIFTSSPDELARFQAAESQKWGRVIRAAGIVPE